MFYSIPIVIAKFYYTISQLAGVACLVQLSDS